MYVYSASKEITQTNVQNWIQSFRSDILPKYQQLDLYYKGKDDLNKVQTELDKSNKRKPNIIHSNLAKMIVTNACGYFIGKPVTYTFKDPAFETKARNIFYRCDEQAENQTLAKNASKYGIAYELMALDDNKNLYIKSLSPLNTFFVVDDTIQENKICAITYWLRKNANGNTITQGFVYGREKIYKFTDEPEATLEKTDLNPFKPVIPVFEYANNDEQSGDYAPVTELLSAYSKLISSNFDDVDSIANSILALINATLDQDESKEFSKSRIIQLLGSGDKADIKYVNKQLDKEYVEYLRNALREDIFAITNVPDMTDEKFAGNQSGVALSYKLLGFENLRLIKQNYFEKGLFQRLTCLLNYKELTGTKKELNEGDVIITFYANLPRNIDRDQQIAELYNAGVLSLKTTLEEMETVDDVDEELKRIDEEKPEIDDLNNMEPTINAKP